MKLINLTPHPIVLCNIDGTILETIPSSGNARITQMPGEAMNLGFSVPVMTPNTYGEVLGLPEPNIDTMYIVSFMLATALKRCDLVSPGTGPNDNVIRDENNKIIGVTRLISHSELL